MSRGGLSAMVRFHCLKVGVKLSAHSFRKYLQTNLDVAGVSPNLVDRILGHKLGGSRDPYSQPSDEQLLEAYKGAYQNLRVYPDKTETEERLLKVEKELTERNSVIGELVSNGAKKTSEVEDLRAQVKTFEAKLNNALDLLSMMTREATHNQVKAEYEKLRRLQLEQKNKKET